jgi:hypothetical protein
MSDVNPYAAPSTEAGPAGRTLVLADEVRRMLVRTSMLMIVAACIEMAATTLDLLTGEISKVTIATTAVFLLLPMFVLLAGASLRRLSKPGDDHAALQIGLRNLFVVYAIKGGLLLLLLALGLISMVWVFV